MHERKRVLSVLASWILRTDLTVAIIRDFRPLLPELLFQITRDTKQALNKDPHFTSENTTISFLAAVVATSRIVFVARYLLPQALEFFSSCPSPVQLLVMPSVLEALKSPAPVSSVLAIVEEVLSALYRLLKIIPNEVHRVWNWSGLFRLVETGSLRSRTFACQCLVLLLGLSDQETRSSAVCKDLLDNNSFIAEYGVANSCKRFSFKELKRRLSLLRFDEKEARELQLLHDEHVISFDSTSSQPGVGSAQLPITIDEFEGGVVTAADLEAPFVDVCGLLLPKNLSNAPTSEATSRTKEWGEYQHTPTSIANLRSLALAVCKADPILLAGPTGAGKTHTIQYLAYLTNNTSTYQASTHFLFFPLYCTITLATLP